MAQLAHEVKYIPNFKRCDTHGVLRDLEAAELVTPDQSINNKFAIFIDTVRAAVLNNTPVKRVGSTYPPWFTAELKSLVREKKLLHLRFKKL